MTKNKLLDKKLIKIGIDVNNCNEALDTLSKLLFENGYVKQSYIKAIKDREEMFATGLPSEGVGVAIPHANIEHVNEPSIAIGLLKKPVSFKMMGNHDEEVDVEIMIMLALNEHHAQLEMLQSLMGLIQDRKLLESLLVCESQESVLSILDGQFSS